MIRKYMSILLSAALIFLAPYAALAQCIIPAGTAVVKTANYSALAADAGKLIVMNCTSACTLTLPATIQTPNWTIWVSSIGTVQAVVSPNGLQLNGSTSSVQIPPGIGEGFMITTDASNYFASMISQNFYATGGGTAQAQTALPTNAVAAYTDGLTVCWKPIANNTSSGPTLAISGLSPVTIAKTGGLQLVGNDITTTSIACATYNSTQPRFELQNPQSTSGGTLGMRRVCDMAVGDTSGNAVTNAQLGPQKRLCFVPSDSTILEMDVAADGGTPSVIVGVNHAGTTSNIVSSALATAASGGIACSRTAAQTCIDGTTNASGTLQNTGMSRGDYIELVSGTAGGVAKLMTIHVIYTVN